MSDADIGSANILVPAQGTSWVISNMNARHCANGSRLLLWNTVATVATVTSASRSFSSPARSGASLFCSSVGAPHTHFWGDSVTTFPVYAGSSPPSFWR
jgi:hypothetical protein